MDLWPPPWDRRILLGLATGTGMIYSEEEYEGLCREAGFTEVRRFLSPRPHRHYCDEGNMISEHGAMRKHSVVIYHNPRCSKSRSACELIVARGINAEVIDYQATPPSREGLRGLLKNSA